MVPKSKEVLKDAFSLAEEALSDIELSRVSLTNVALKASRISRLLNDPYRQKLFQLEASGYPHKPGGFDQEIWDMLKFANRITEEEDLTTKNIKKYGYWHSIEQIEQSIESDKTRLSIASDPNVSISSANPYQIVHNPAGNKTERNLIQQNLSRSIERLSQRRAFLHEYISNIYTELRYSKIAEDIFSNIRSEVDANIANKVSSATNKLISVYENLSSENPEDWANAVHSCRRILQDLADALFPPTDQIEKKINGKKKEIKLGKDQYINRLIAYVESKTESKRFKSIVGSHLNFIGDRLDSVFSASQKGSHAEIVDRNEANRYIIYTYLLVGDILSL